MKFPCGFSPLLAKIEIENLRLFETWLKADQKISMAKGGNKTFFLPHWSQCENSILDGCGIGANGNET